MNLTSGFLQRYIATPVQPGVGNGRVSGLRFGQDGTSFSGTEQSQGGKTRRKDIFESLKERWEGLKREPRIGERLIVGGKGIVMAFLHPLTLISAVPAMLILPLVVTSPVLPLYLIGAAATVVFGLVSGFSSLPEDLEDRKKAWWFDVLTK